MTVILAAAWDRWVVDRLVRTLNRLEGSTVGLNVLAGAALCLGLSELFSAVAGQLSPALAQAIILNTMLFLAPLVVTLLLLLQCGPDLILRGEEACSLATAAGHPQRWWRFCSADIGAVGLISPLLLLQFLAAALVMATISSGSQGLQQLGLLAGAIDPLNFGRALLRSAVFAGCGAVIFCRQGSRRSRGGHTSMDQLVRAIVQTVAVLFGLSLLWVVLLDPLNLS